MKKLFLSFTVALAFILVFSSSGTAAALEDLVTVPTAEVLSYQGSISGVASPDRGEVEGVYSLNPDLEIGGVLRYNQNRENHNLGPLIKLALSEEEQKQPAIATGIKNSDIYLVLSKNLGYGIRGHMGSGNGRYNGLFLGINKIINPVEVEINEGESEGNLNNSIPPINLMAEYVDQEINLGMRTNLTNNLYLDLGVLNLEDLRAGVTVAF